ncbi:hypothetical protein EGW08_020700, partial [Elysia chlorotica]
MRRTEHIPKSVAREHQVLLLASHVQTRHVRVARDERFVGGVPYGPGHRDVPVHSPGSEKQHTTPELFDPLPFKETNLSLWLVGVHDLDGLPVPHQQSLRVSEPGQVEFVVAIARPKCKSLSHLPFRFLQEPRVRGLVGLFEGQRRVCCEVGVAEQVVVQVGCSVVSRLDTTMPVKHSKVALAWPILRTKR